MASLRRLIPPVLGLALLSAMLLQARLWPARQSTSAPPPVLPVSAVASGIIAEGRVTTYPGAEVVLGTDVDGTILKLPVKEKDWVHKGQIIGELRANDIRAAIDVAEAQLREAVADIQFYELEFQRAEKLWYNYNKAGSQQGLDRANHDLAAARARRERAVADVRRLQATLEKYQVMSPIDGVVLERHAHPGESLQEGAPVITIADLNQRRIEAEVDEYDVGHVQLGMAATITAEGYDGQSWRGRVEEIPDNVVLRRIKPQDPARPTDTRVLLVKIALIEDTPLKLGQRVEVRIADKK